MFALEKKLPDEVIGSVWKSTKRENIYKIKRNTRKFIFFVWNL